jgi:hypothetical protein
LFFLFCAKQLSRWSRMVCLTSTKQLRTYKVMLIVMVKLAIPN